MGSDIVTVRTVNPAQQSIGLQPFTQATKDLGGMVAQGIIGPGLGEAGDYSR